MNNTRSMSPLALRRFLLPALGIFLLSGCGFPGFGEPEIVDPASQRPFVIYQLQPHREPESGAPRTTPGESVIPQPPPQATPNVTVATNTTTGLQRCVDQSEPVASFAGTPVDTLRAWSDASEFHLARFLLTQVYGQPCAEAAENLAAHDGLVRTRVRQLSDDAITGSIPVGFTIDTLGQQPIDDARLRYAVETATSILD